MSPSSARRIGCVRGAAARSASDSGRGPTPPRTSAMCAASGYALNTGGGAPQSMPGARANTLPRESDDSS